MLLKVLYHPGLIRFPPPPLPFQVPPNEGRRDAGGGAAAHLLPVEPSGAAEGSGSMVQQRQAGLNSWFAELKRCVYSARWSATALAR